MQDLEGETKTDAHSGKDAALNENNGPRLVNIKLGEEGYLHEVPVKYFREHDEDIVVASVDDAAFAAKNHKGLIAGLGPTEREAAQHLADMIASGMSLMDNTMGMSSEDIDGIVGACRYLKDTYFQKAA